MFILFVELQGTDAQVRCHRTVRGLSCRGFFKNRQSTGQKINDGHYDHRSKQPEHPPIKHGSTTAKRPKCSRAPSHCTSRSATPRQSLYRSFEAARNENSCRTLASMDSQDSPRPWLARPQALRHRRRPQDQRQPRKRVLDRAQRDRRLPRHERLRIGRNDQTSGRLSELSSALRLVVLAWFRNRAEAA